ncbi:MAG: hypothetical protein NXI10_02420 [bacterium]|nr:hypothetical protein [bacterium]
MEKVNKLHYKSYHVLIIVVFALAAGSVGFKLIMDNSNPVPKNVEEFVINYNGHAKNDTLTVTYLNQYSKDSTDKVKKYIQKETPEQDSSEIDSTVLESHVSGHKKKHKSTFTMDVHDAAYHQNTSFLNWTLLIIIMMSIAGGACVVFVYEIRTLTVDLENRLRIIGICLGLAILFGAAAGYFSGQGGNILKPSDFIDKFGVILEGGWVLDAVVRITLFLQLPIITTVFIIPVVADKITLKGNDKRSIEAASRALNKLEATLKRCLHTMAALVVFSVLTSTALGASLNDAIDIPGFEIYPDEVSYAYGLLFSFLLAMIYIPVHLYIRAKSRELLDQVYEGAKKDASLDLKEAKTELVMTQSALQNLKVAFAVAAPIVSSFLPSFISLM